VKNPFKPEQPPQHRDNPFVPDVVERPAERAADRAATRDNPLVPNAIERPFERAVGGDRGVVVNDRGRADGPFLDESPAGRTGVIDDPSVVRSATTVDLFPNEELAAYRTRWEAIQTGFVDQPRAAVEQADALVSQVMNQLTDVFARERSTLEGQWTKGDNVSTEDLRIALTRYRSFFHRLLSM
jgi:hypothetical protein